MRWSVWVFAVVIGWCSLARPCEGRIHRLSLHKEHRRYFIISSFGLLQGGAITINTSKLEVLSDTVQHVGLSVHRSSEESTEYNLNAGMSGPEACIFSPSYETDDATVRLEMDLTTGAFQAPTENLTDLVLESRTLIGAHNEPVHQVKLAVASEAAEDIYTIAFHLCSPTLPSINLELHMVELNPNSDYLGAGQAPLPTVYAVMSGLFFITTLVWVHVLFRFRDSSRLFKVHFLMLALLFVKTLSLMFHSIDYHFIKTEGSPEEGWAVTYYIVHLTKGALLFLTVLLIGAGFGFIKSVLSSREKRLFAIVLGLQVFSNIAAVVMEETSEGAVSRNFWHSIALLVDLLCCGAILFPIVWSIRHLRDASSIDGKAEQSIHALKLFRRFYVLILCYIYTTRIVVYLIGSVVPFHYVWVGPFFNELAGLCFYVLTGFWFAPVPTNTYLRVPDEEPEEIQMEEIVVANAVGDGMHARKGAASTTTA